MEPQEGAVLSPLNEEPKYDYNKLRDETSVEAIKEIWKMLGENSEKLVYTTKSDIKEIQENHEEISQKIVEILVDKKVPNKDMQWLVEQIQTVVYSVFDIEISSVFCKIFRIIFCINCVIISSKNACVCEICAVVISAFV